MFSNVRGAMKYAMQRGLKVGVTSRSVVMMEFEHDEVLPCVQFLSNPIKVVYNANVDRACEKLKEDVRKFILLQFAVAMTDSKWYYHIPRTKTGEFVGPLYMAATSKSFHIIGPLRFTGEKFTMFYNLARTELKYIDQRYIDYTLEKMYATLRLSSKDGVNLPRMIALYELAELAVKKWVVQKIRCSVAVRDFINGVLATFNQMGMMVMWC